jgi:TonB family protein
MSRDNLHTVDAEETITVPGGTFRTFKITWRNKYTNALLAETWYAPDVKQWVKVREVLSNGIREREFLGFSEMPPIRRDLRPIAKDDIPYPREAAKARIEGKVVARMWIDGQGNVSEVTIVAADPPKVFDQTVIDTLKKWKFAGDGTKYVGEIETKFELK